MSPLKNSRRRVIPLPSQSKSAGVSTLTFRLPKTGMLAAILLDIRGAVAGTLSAPNAMGFSCIVKNVELSVNGGIRIHSFSGPQYHYLIRDQLEDFVDVVSQTNGRTAITATTYNISMYIPIAINLRDPLGLIMLQNEQTEVTLSVEWEADASVATGVTSITGTIKPTMIVFSVPENKADWPDFTMLHSLIGETRTISGAGKFQYTPIRGQTYAQLLLGCGMAASGADRFNSIAVKVLGNDQMEYWEPQSLDLDFNLKHGRTRLAGVAPLDWLGSSGLGSFGSARDAILSQNISDLTIEIDATQAETLHAVRRQLIQLT